MAPFVGLRKPWTRRRCGVVRSPWLGEATTPGSFVDKHRLSAGLTNALLRFLSGIGNPEISRGKLRFQARRELPF